MAFSTSPTRTTSGITGPAWIFSTDEPFCAAAFGPPIRSDATTASGMADQDLRPWPRLRGSKAEPAQAWSRRSTRSTLPGRTERDLAAWGDLPTLGLALGAQAHAGHLLPALERVPTRLGGPPAHVARSRSTRSPPEQSTPPPCRAVRRPHMRVARLVRSLAYRSTA